MYWQIFWTAFDGDPDGLNYEWWSGSAHFHKQVGPGDSLWVVVSGQGLGRPGEWRLLQRMVVKNTLKPDKDAAFPYGVQGDPKNSPKYKIKDQPDFALEMRKLRFRSGKRLTAKGALIGRALQTIRPLADADVAMLESYARDLATR